MTTRRADPRRRPLEKVEQQHIITLARSIGCQVYVLGTRRPKGDYPGTRQTPGIPDLWMFLPMRHPDCSGLWWEVKRKGGTRTPEQMAFGESCALAGQRYGFGTANDFCDYLIRHGYLRPEQVSHERRRA